MSRGAAKADFQGAKTGFQGAKNTRKVVSALEKWFQLVGCGRLWSAMVGCGRLTVGPGRSRIDTPHLVAAAQRRSGYLFSSSITARFWKKKMSKKMMGGRAAGGRFCVMSFLHGRVYRRKGRFSRCCSSLAQPLRRCRGSRGFARSWTPSLFGREWGSKIPDFRDLGGK